MSMILVAAFFDPSAWLCFIHSFSIRQMLNKCLFFLYFYSVCFALIPLRRDFICSIWINLLNKFSLSLSFSFSFSVFVLWETGCVDAAQSSIIFYYRCCCCCYSCRSSQFKLQTICTCISMCEFLKKLREEAKKPKPNRKVLLWWHFKRQNTFTRACVWELVHPRAHFIHPSILLYTHRPMPSDLFTSICI